MGDGHIDDQSYGLHVITSTDGMTADYSPFDHAFLGRVASRIINEVRGINRVTYGITSKPPGDDRVRVRDTNGGNGVVLAARSLKHFTASCGLRNG